MKRTIWTDRKFSFDFPEGWIADIMERLRGTEFRIIAMTDGLTDDETEFKPDGKWSIKEHIGHLADLEELHSGRLDDFLSGKDSLRPADMSNAKTNAANHNEKSREALIREFSDHRKKLVEKFLSLDDKMQKRNLFHPRLQINMRPIDVAFFAAEHDDHHLASIREILEMKK